MKIRNYIIVYLLVCLCIIFSFFIFDKLKDTPIKDDFLSGVKRVYKVAKKQYKIDKENEFSSISYQKGLTLNTGTDIKQLDLNNDELNYVVKFNKKGDISYIRVLDKENEIELGNEDNNMIVELTDIKVNEIKSYKDISNDLFTIVEKNDKSYEIRRGYKKECDESACFVNIYLGNVNDKSYFKIENVLENEDRYTFIDNTSNYTNYITPYVRIKLSSKAKSLYINDLANNINFEELKEESESNE